MTTRIGLLGAARIAPSAIVKPVSKRTDCEIVAVGCRNTERGRDFAVEHIPGARVTDYAGICTASDIDMVYCALPPSEHLKWVSLALESGKAVLCEKPFSMGEADARLMVETAKRADRYVMEAFHYFFHPAYQSLLARYKSGEFGKALSYKGVFSAEIPNRPGELRYVPELGGGALMDLGCYPLHAARQLLGEPDVLSVDCAKESGVDVMIDAQLECEGVPINIVCDMRTGVTRNMYFELECEKVSIRFDSFVHPYTGYRISIGNEIETGKGPITYDAQLDAFLAAMHGGPVVLSSHDAVSQMSVIETIYKEVSLR